MDFEWANGKNEVNITKHGLSFNEAESTCSDKKRIITLDVGHSTSEKRYFCIGKRM